MKSNLDSLETLSLPPRSTEVSPALSVELNSPITTAPESFSVANPEPDVLTFEDAYPKDGLGTPFNQAKYPMLDASMAFAVRNAKALEIAPLKDAQEPDFKLSVSEDGSLKLEKIGTADPMDDGKLTVAVDTKDESLAQAIKQADQNLKEYIRELMSYWRESHPGESPPGWWQDILNSQPAIPSDAKPLPVTQSAELPQSVLPPSVLPQGKDSQISRASDTPPSQPSPSNATPADSGASPTVGSSSGSDAGSGSAPRQSNYVARASNPSDYAPASLDSGSGSISGEQSTAETNAMIVERVAKEVGVDPKLAVAMMLVESGGDNRAVGDNGTSFGLFQLHQGGMLTEAGLTPSQAYDPETNARVSLTALSKLNPGDYSSPGAMAAASQRPENPTEYAQKINAAMPQAEQLLASARSNQAEMAANGNVPPPSEFNQRLAQAVLAQDARMSGQGRCAEAVQLALADSGLSQFVGSGNAWDMKDPLLRSGLFEVVPAGQATTGDIIIRPPSSNPNDNSIYGDISVVTSRQGQRIIQTNDDSYEFHANNSRYDGKAVFLRYKGNSA